MKDKKSMKLLACIVSSVVLTAVIAVFIAGYVKKQKQPDTANLIEKTEQNGGNRGGKLFNASDISLMEEVVTVSTEIIEDGLRNIGTLVTEEYYFTQVESYEKDTTTVLNLKSTAVITYSYDGVVNAGVDCGGISVSKDDEQKVIRIVIPPATIQNVVIDNDSFQIYEEKQGIWSKIGLADVNQSQIEFKEAAEKRALERGILTNADKNAEQLIDRFVKSLVDTEDYTVTYIHGQEEKQ